MKKIVFTVIGFAFTLSFLGSHDFNSVALNKGDGGGAPARPDYISFNKGDGGAPADFNRGDGGISKQF
ncbi:hypothetical protein ACTFQN_19115 [Bacillus cereus group sp. MYBK30-1]|uniref:hypothetical protein n=1 Tax=unclassified Bacillus cereus group TaxID=2750818 RepID=UPI003F78FD58